MGIRQMRERNIWSMGDWLVNYQGGFVRRGLPGEVAFLAGHLFHISPSWLVLCMQCTCYAAMFFSFYRLLIGLRLKLWTTAILLSPATLIFHLMEYPSGFRKETIFLGGLGVLVLILLRGTKSDAWISAYTTVFVAICILSHDAPILYGGLLLAALAIGLGTGQRLLKVLIYPAICTFCMLALTLTHHGDRNTSRQICTSMGYDVGPEALPHPCEGEITQIGLTLREERSEASYTHPAYHYSRIYPALIFLACVPFLLAFPALWRWKQGRPLLKILLFGIVLTVCSTCVLFYMTIDWGRWVYIGVFGVSLLLMMIENMRQSSPDQDQVDQPELRSRTHLRLRKTAGVLLLICYAFGWHLPHSRPFGPYFHGFSVNRYLSF